MIPFIESYFSLSDVQEYMYCSVLGKHAWALKYNLCFRPIALTWDMDTWGTRLMEAAIFTP